MYISRRTKILRFVFLSIVMTVPLALHAELMNISVKHYYRDKKGTGHSSVAKVHIDGNASLMDLAVEVGKIIRKQEDDADFKISALTFGTPKDIVFDNRTVKEICASTNMQENYLDATSASRTIIIVLPNDAWLYLPVAVTDSVQSVLNRLKIALKYDISLNNGFYTTIADGKTMLYAPEDEKCLGNDINIFSNKQQADKAFLDVLSDERYKVLSLNKAFPRDLEWEKIYDTKWHVKEKIGNLEKALKRLNESLVKNGDTINFNEMSKIKQYWPNKSDRSKATKVELLYDSWGSYLVNYYTFEKILSDLGLLSSDNTEKALPLLLERMSDDVGINYSIHNSLKALVEAIKNCKKDFEKVKSFFGAGSVEDDFAEDNPKEVIFPPNKVRNYDLHVDKAVLKKALERRLVRWPYEVYKKMFSQEKIESLQEIQTSLYVFEKIQEALNLETGFLRVSELPNNNIDQDVDYKSLNETEHAYSTMFARAAKELKAQAQKQDAVYAKRREDRKTQREQDEAFRKLQEEEEKRRQAIKAQQDEEEKKKALEDQESDNKSPQDKGDLKKLGTSQSHQSFFLRDGSTLMAAGGGLLIAGTVYYMWKKWQKRKEQQKRKEEEQKKKRQAYEAHVLQQGDAVVEDAAG